MSDVQEQPAPSVAIAFLRAALADGQEHLASEVQVAAEQAGIGEKALRRAREEIAETRQEGRAWRWRLREQPDAPDTSEAPPVVMGAAPCMADGFLPLDSGISWLDELGREHRRLLHGWARRVHELGGLTLKQERQRREHTEAVKDALQSGGPMPPDYSVPIQQAEAQILSEAAREAQDELARFVVDVLAVCRERRVELDGLTLSTALRRALSSAPGGTVADREERLRTELSSMKNGDGEDQIVNLAESFEPTEEVERVTVGA